MDLITETKIASTLNEMERTRLHSMLSSNELLLERDQAFKIIGTLLKIGSGKFDLELVTRFIANQTNISEERVSEILTRAKATLSK